MSGKERILAKAPTKSPYTAPRNVLPFRPFSAAQPTAAPEASKMSEEDLRSLRKNATSVAKLKEKLKTEKGLEMSDKHVKQLLVDKDIQPFKGFKKSKNL